LSAIINKVSLSVSQLFCLHSHKIQA